MLNHNIHKILIEIFDVYHTSEYFMKYVDKDKNIDTLLFLKDPSFKLSLCYNFIWNQLLKTYPTKKDTNDFIKKQDLTSIVFNETLLNQVLVNNILAFKNNKIDETILQKYKELTQNFENFDYITPLIYDKLRYRYNCDTEDTKDNLILTVVNIISNSNDVIKEVSLDINPISGFRVFNLTWTSQDNEWMTLFEKQQYIICKDLHFILKIINNPIIYLEDNITLSEDIVDIFGKSHECNVLI